jgi:hypothetical protein
MFYIQSLLVRSLCLLYCPLVPAQLQNIDQVYIKRGGVHKPLLSLNEGPYKVVLKASKYFQVDIGGRVEAVSLLLFRPKEVGPASLHLVRRKILCKVWILPAAENVLQQ